jgi:trk system potassium uptake protein TrkH
MAAGEGGDVGWIDAFFTATSAVCVTGLITVDTARAWSPLGQGIILALIQLGGLGILTFSTFFVVLFGRRMTLSQRDIVTRAHGRITRIDVRGLIVRVVTYALAIEAAGAVVLSIYFAREEGLATGLWQGTFHAISAFCNAGFSLFTLSLEGYSGSWIVNVVVMVLVLLGGIGFIVIADVEASFRQRKRLSLHSRVVLTATGVLLLVGAVGFAAFEAENVLRGRSMGEKVLITLFQTVTPRTAGFNTVPYADLTNSTLMLTMILMFIGGSPGSAAGGVKTTTAAILWGLMVARARGFRNSNLFHRSIPERVVGEASTVVLLSIGFIMLMTFALQFTELHNMSHRDVRGMFLALNFEAVSAFSTVGLSMGATGALHDASKLVIILLMFVGRLGPLTIAVAIGRRRKHEYEYAEEGVLVG